MVKHDPKIRYIPVMRDTVSVINNTSFPLDVAVFAVNKKSNLGYRVSSIRRLPAFNSDIMNKWMADEKACLTKLRRENPLGLFSQSSSVATTCTRPFLVPYQRLSMFDRQHQLYVYFAVAPNDPDPSFTGYQTPTTMRGCWVETVDVMCHRKQVPSGTFPSITISTNDLLSSKTDLNFAPPMCMQGHANNAWTKGENGLESGGTCRTAGTHRTKHLRAVRRK
jgi:hypothetical protein